MGKLIVITSGKGGVGKSTVAVGLASALNNGKKSVLLIDADAGLRCLDLMLSASENLVFDLADVVLGNATPSQAIYSVNGEGLYLLAAPSKENSVENAKISINNGLVKITYKTKNADNIKIYRTFNNKSECVYNGLPINEYFERLITFGKYNYYIVAYGNDKEIKTELPSLRYEKENLSIFDNEKWLYQ